MEKNVEPCAWCDAPSVYYADDDRPYCCAECEQEAAYWAAADEAYESARDDA